MNDSIRLGRIAGIPIGLNWTWLLIFGFLVWSLAWDVFPFTDPGLGTRTYVAMAAVAVLLFFGSLLLHELGHALEARREGVAIDGITLWLFGGVARFRGLFPSAGAEFRIAIAGPLVTAALGALFLALAQLTHFTAAIDGVIAWLAYINVILLAFNLLPALPLDGGRVFRSALWRLRGDFAWATSVAAAVGRGFGVLMIAAGAFAFLASGLVSGLWLAVVGWFLFQAAGSEGGLATVWRSLRGLVVADLMRPPPQSLQAGQPLSDAAAEVLWGDRSGIYPILEGDRALGVLPAGAITQAAAGGWPPARVRDRMVPLSEVPQLAPSEPAVNAVLALVDGHAPGAVVLEDGRIVGIVLLSDLEDALRRGDSGRSSWRGRTTVAPLAPARARARRPSDGPSRDAA